MRRFIPSQIEEETKIVKNFSFLDLIILFVGAVLMVLVLASSFPNWLKILLVIVISVAFIVSVIKFDMVKGYKLLTYGLLYMFRRKRYKNVNLIDGMGLKFGENYVQNGGSYVAVIELDGVDFAILEERTQDDYIAIFNNLLKEIKNGKIVKFEKPLDLSKFIKWNDTLLSSLADRQGEEEEPDAALEIRIEMLNNQNEYLERFQFVDRIFIDGFYLVLFDNNTASLDILAAMAENTLNQLGLAPKRLNEKELRVFTNLYLKTDVSDFFEEDIRTEAENSDNSTSDADGEQGADGEENSSQNANSEVTDVIGKKIDVIEKGTSFVVDNSEMRIICLGKYPYFVGNAWGYELFTIPDTKVIFNFSEYAGKNVSKRISRSMTELDSRINNKKTREDERKKLLIAYQSLDALLETLDIDAEKLYNTECYLMYPKQKHREIMRLIRSKGIKINDLLWSQYDGWVSTNPFIPMPSKNNKERVSPIQSSSVAGMFPFVSKMLYDDNGFFLGLGSTGKPIFFNQFTKTQKRVNHNMVVFGKSGGGKSFFMKKLVLRSAMENRMVFVLDPDNEYDVICKTVKGNWIDVAGEKSGRMNPLHVFASMQDDEGGNVGDLSSHKLFLDEFFRTVLPDMSDTCRLYLNECIADLYAEFKITDMSDMSLIEPTGFPTFADLYELIQLKGDVMEDIGTQKQTIELLKLNIKQFVGEGVYARLWNGPTTLNVNNDFNVMNFQSLFANNNSHIANGQMLLLMRFLNQEVIKNRERNKKGGNRKIEIWIDEAHRFIDPTFPVALKFMSTMAKQIRKYDGALVVATQNIADFVGVSDKMRAAATAVINSCQYSMIFGLLANDINQIKDLYSNYNGGLTAQEVDYIGHALRGDALFIVDPNTRLPLHITLYDNEEKYII